MSLSLECKKVRRTGFLPAFLCGGMLAAAVPVVNMAVRSEMYAAQQGTPVQILLGANWQMMAMLNVLLIVAGTCLLYHTEYADNAAQKMQTLPVRESVLFFGKAVLTILMSALVLVMEAGAVLCCTYRWFEIGNGFWRELGESFGYALLLVMPCILLSLLIAQAFTNMWVSLGIGVVCVFMATMLPTDHFILSLFPYALPFQILNGTHHARYICAAAAELAVVSTAELLFIKVRRSLE